MTNFLFNHGIFLTMEMMIRFLCPSIRSFFFGRNLSISNLCDVNMITINYELPIFDVNVYILGCSPEAVESEGYKRGAQDSRFCLVGGWRKG